MPDFPTAAEAGTLAHGVSMAIKERARASTSLSFDEIDLLLVLARRNNDEEARTLAIACLTGATDYVERHSVGDTAALATVLLTAFHLTGDDTLLQRVRPLLSAFMNGVGAATTDAEARAAVASLQASWVLDNDDYQTRGLQLLDTLLERARPSDALLRRIADPDASDAPDLDDQVEAGRALLDAYEVSGRKRFLDQSHRIADASLTFFGDFAVSPAGTVHGKVRGAEWLARLSMATAEAGYQERAKGILAALRELPLVLSAGPTSAAFALAYLRVAEEPVHIVIPGPPDDARTQALLGAALRVDHWHRLAQAADPAEDGDLLDALGYYAGPQPMAYVCYNLTCSPSISDPALIASAVKRMANNTFAAVGEAPNAPAVAPFLSFGGRPMLGFGMGTGNVGSSEKDEARE